MMYTFVHLYLILYISMSAVIHSDVSHTAFAQLKFSLIFPHIVIIAGVTPSKPVPLQS